MPAKTVSACGHCPCVRRYVGPGPILHVSGQKPWTYSKSPRDHFQNLIRSIYSSTKLSPFWVNFQRIWPWRPFRVTRGTKFAILKKSLNQFAILDKAGQVSITKPLVLIDFNQSLNLKKHFYFLILPFLGNVIWFYKFQVVFSSDSGGALYLQFWLTDWLTD